jgi:cytochrome c peroxidase
MSSNVKRWSLVTMIVTLVIVLLIAGQGLAQSGLTPVEQLGEKLYFDTNLSEPAGQSCASCHDPGFGFADPDRGLPVSEGVIPGLFGGRNSPSSAYAMYAPIRYFDDVEGLYIGGQFWDSRATGEVLGDPLADQALGPFLNPVEMANPDKATVVRDALGGDYGALFAQECGTGDLTDTAYVEAAYDCIASSIGAFERTAMFGQFSSKYDHYLQACLAAGGIPEDCAAGVGTVAQTVGQKFFAKKEWAGFQLFVGENNNDGVLEPGEGAMCAACHVVDWVDPATLANNVVVPDWAPGGMIPPLFTDFTYDNLGVPANPRIAELTGSSAPDLGLGPIVGNPDEDGKFKVMTLRNIHLTGPYAHNGFFKKLEDITHFYNTRDVGMWPAAEVPETVNHDELGNLGLSDKDEDLLVKFMKTLDDGWVP